MSVEGGWRYFIDLCGFNKITSPTFYSGYGAMAAADEDLTMIMTEHLEIVEVPDVNTYTVNWQMETGNPCSRVQTEGSVTVCANNDEEALNKVFKTYRKE